MKNFITKMFYKQREEFELASAARNQDFTCPDGVILHKDLYYAKDWLPAHRLDIFCPENAAKPLPVIINVHGGGLLLGNKEYNRPFCSLICKEGYLVFSLEYRLVPDCEFYDQLSDFFTALEFIRHSLHAYGGDPKRVYGVGDSGGACLLVYAAAIQRSRALAAAAHVQPSRPMLRALGLISGMFYTTRFDKIGIFLPRYLFGKHYKQTAFAPYANPEHPKVCGSLPPCFLITSGSDHLEHYTLDFERALTARRVKHKLLHLPADPRLVHAFSVVDPDMPESAESIHAILDFFNAH